MLPGAPERRFQFIICLVIHLIAALDSMVKRGWTDHLTRELLPPMSLYALKLESGEFRHPMEVEFCGTRRM